MALRIWGGQTWYGGDRSRNPDIKQLDIEVIE
jgi:hypothetical protein